MAWCRLQPSPAPLFHEDYAPRPVLHVITLYLHYITVGAMSLSPYGGDLCLRLLERGEEYQQAPDDEAWSRAREDCSTTRVHYQEVIAIPLPLRQRCDEGQLSTVQQQVAACASMPQTDPG
jgi:hypothetical protein